MANRSWAGAVSVLLIAAGGWAGARGQGAGPVVTIARPIESDSAIHDFPCRLAPVETVEVRAPLAGTVARVAVAVGSEVKAGAVLVELTPRYLAQDLKQAEADVKQRTAELQKADKDLARAQKPAKKKADEFDVAREQARRDLAALVLKLAQAEVARLRQDEEAARVKAPIAGRVVTVAAPGDQVEGGPRSASRLAVLARTDAVRAAFAVDEKTMLQMRARPGKGAAGTTPDVPVRLRLPAEPEFGHAGKLEFVGNRVDPKSGQIPVTALFPNPGAKLTPAALAAIAGGPAKKQAGPEKKERPPLVRLQLGAPRKLLLIPGRAVAGDDRGGHFVLVVDGKDVIARRPVKLGPWLGRYQAIEDGLRADEWVVVIAGEAKRDPEDATVSPEDFLPDARLAGLRPGTTVRPVRAVLPRPDAGKP